MTADRFVYIENQYFLSSSYYWGLNTHPCAENLIGLALADKIVSKIEVGEDFVAYIIVPLFPEGMRGLLNLFLSIYSFLSILNLSFLLSLFLTSQTQMHIHKGIPDSMGVQTILHWQFKTVRMMYQRIIAALKKKGSDRSPTDYLLFMCLGNREVAEVWPFTPIHT